MPDYDLEPPRDYQLDDDDTSIAPSPPTRRRMPAGPLIAGLAVVIVGVAGALWMLYRPTPEAPAAPVAPPPTIAPTAAPTATRGPLPDLDASDAFVRDLAAAFSSHPELARWLGQVSLVRKLAAVVADIAHGETPRAELELLAPAQRFRAGGAGGRIVADPDAYASYDAFADAIASLDAAVVADAYRATEPLFDAAYRDIGYPGGFRPGLEAAIRELLEVPVPRADAELVAYPGGFRWADPALESLTAAQKQFLRTGPRNVRLVQGKLRELQTALRADGR